MAMESSTSSAFPVLLDTNLGTHLFLTINRDDTVAQLRGKIMSEHPRCFPQIGEISIEALKVKYGDVYYHLADSTIVRLVFEHINGARFLDIDLVPASCTISNHTQAIVGDNDVQLQNCIPLSINHSASLIPISVPRELENTILPGACEQTPSELETEQIEEQAISGAHVQQSFDNDANIINKNERVELEHKDAAVEPKKDAPLVSNNNEKYHKRNSSLLGDEILSENHHVGKRKHKKDKDVNLDSFHEAAAQFDSSMQDPNNAKLKRKKKKVLSSNDELPQNNSVNGSLHMVDAAVKGNQTTEKFVEVMVSNAPQVEYDERVELEHKNASVEPKKDAPLVSDKNENHQKPNTSLLDNEILPEKDHVGKRKHKEDKDVNLDSFHEAAQFDSSTQDLSDVKLKRKKKKVLSSNHELPQNNRADESLPKVDDVAKENETTKNFVEGMVSSSKDMGKETEIVVPKDANSLHSNTPQVEHNKNEKLEVEHKKAAVETKKDSPLVSNKNEKYQKHNTSLHGDEILSKKDHVGKRKYKKDKDVHFDGIQEAAVQFDSSMQDPSNVRLKRKKKKVIPTNDELPQNNPAGESLPKVIDAAKENETTENLVEAVVSNGKDIGKESEIVAPKEASSLHSNITQVESLGQAGVDTKRKRRKKVLEEPPQNKPINNSLDGTDASAQEKPIKHCVGEITNKNVKLGTNSKKSVTHGHDSSGKINATSKEIQAQEILAQEIQVQENHEVELLPQNNSVDKSPPKVDDAAKENQTTEFSEEVMLSKNKDQGRESELVVPKEAISLHSNTTQVQSLGLAGVDTKRKRRKKVFVEPPQNELINNSLGEVDASAQEKSINENRVEITNENAKLGKNSEVTDTLGHDSSGKNKENPNKTTVDESKITLSPADKKKRRTNKNKEKTEPLVQERQSSKHGIVGSSIDQVTLNLPKAPSVDQPEKLNAGLNGGDVVEDISNEKKPKRSRKKSEKIEHEATMPSNTLKIVNLTVDQVNEDSTKELPDNPTSVMEATTAEAVTCDKKPKRGRKRNASIEHEHLTAGDGHPVMDTAVQVKPSDQKSKQSKKKSEKANFPSKESSLIKESAKENFKETSTGEIGHTNENSEDVSITVEKIISAELDWVNNQVEAQNYNAKKPVGADFVSDVCKNEKAAKVNQEEMIKGKTENMDENVETSSGIGDNKATAELNNADIKEVPQADTEKIDFMSYFGRIAKQHDVVQEKTSKKTKRERKLKTSPHDSTATVKMLKHEHNITEKKLQESDSSKQSLDSPALQISQAQVDAPKKHESKDTNDIMASNNNSGVVTNNLKEGYMARLDASIGSMGDGTTNQRITSGCAIKKVQKNSPKSKLSNYHGEMLTPGRIFDDDEDSSSDETSISLGADDDNVFRSAFDNPTKSSIRNEPISTILRSTRSYQRAKLSASQTALNDIGSQNVDVVLGTQPMAVSNGPEAVDVRVNLAPAASPRPTLLQQPHPRHYALTCSSASNCHLPSPRSYVKDPTSLSF